LNFIEDDKEALANANEKVRSRKKAIRAYAEGLTDRLPAEYKIDILDLHIRQAQEAKEGAVIAKSGVILPIRVDAEKEMNRADYLPMAVGADNVVNIDMDRMNAQALKNKKG
ncbi:MAG: hypothetical protein RSB90_11450, partial [Eubacterium sp.]